jgi:predicted short-subunit dehydrogenase-like oxidoreductase (DUF2520 family)
VRRHSRFDVGAIVATSFRRRPLVGVVVGFASSLSSGIDILRVRWESGAVGTISHRRVSFASLDEAAAMRDMLASESRFLKALDSIP